MRAFFALILIITPSMALASGMDRVPHSRFPSVRGAGMGDSILGFVDDTQGALFYNPSAFGKLRDFKFEPINVRAAGNSDVTSALGPDSLKYASSSKYVDYLSENPGKTPSSEFSVFPSFRLPYFGMGVLYQNENRSTADSSGINYRSRSLFIPTVGTGFRLASGVLRFGYSLQWVSLAQSTGTVVHTASAATRSNEKITEGSGYSHNGAMTVTLPFHYQPSFQLVARNIGGLNYSGKPIFVSAAGATSAPAKEHLSLDVGTSWFAKFSASSEMKFSIVYRDFTDSSSTARWGHFAFGTEFGLGDLFFFRAGYASAYPTGGFGLKTKHVALDFAWSSDEIGAGLRSSRDNKLSLQLRIHAF